MRIERELHVAAAFHAERVDDVDGARPEHLVVRVRQRLARRDDDRVAGVQCAAVHQDGGHGTAALVEVRLDRHTLRGHVGVGPQVEGGVGSQDDCLQQLVQAGPRRGGAGKKAKACPMKRPLLRP